MSEPQRQPQLFPKGPAPQIAHCARCNVRLQVATSRREDSRPFKKSLTAKGFCLNCIVTKMLKYEASIGQVVRRCKKCGDIVEATTFEGRPCACEKPDLLDPREVCSAPHIQEQFSRLLAVGNCEAGGDEIDWDEVIANWDLPFAKSDKKRWDA